MHISDRRRFCLGLGAMAATARLRAIATHSSSDGASAGPAPLQRPTSGLGSPHLADVSIRQEAKVYKKTPQGDLAAYVFYPPDWSGRDRRPVITFFFGGGWVSGTPAQFFPQAEYFASRGMVSITFEYRKIGKTEGTPDICITDAKSAIRWIRVHAKELGADRNRIVGSGGSAGGQLAAATALITEFDDESSNHPVSCIPNAMVLFNPELDLAGEGYKDATGNSMERRLSPLFYLRAGAPPMILFYGTADPMLTQGERCVAESRRLGNRCELYIAKDQPHAFFNLEPWVRLTALKADDFLKSLGYLKGPSTVRIDDTGAELMKYSA